MFEAVIFCFVAIFTVQWSSVSSLKFKNRISVCISHQQQKLRITRRYLGFGIDCQQVPELTKYLQSSLDANMQFTCTPKVSDGLDSISSNLFSFNPIDDAYFFIGILVLNFVLNRQVINSGDGSNSIDYSNMRDDSFGTHDNYSSCPICSGTRKFNANQYCEACGGTGLVSRFDLPSRRDSKLWELDDNNDGF